MKKKITPKFILGNLDAIVTGSTLVICVIMVNVNVICRYILKSPIKWTEEVVTSLFVWTVFIGSAYAYRKHAHLGVDIVVNLLHGKAQKIVADVVAVVEFAILAMLTTISGQYVYHLIYNAQGKLKLQLTDLLRLPKWYTGIAVPIGFGLSLIYSAIFLLERFKVIKKEILPLEASEETKEGGAQ